MTATSMASLSLVCPSVLLCPHIVPEMEVSRQNPLTSTRQWVKPFDFSSVIFKARSQYNLGSRAPKCDNVESRAPNLEARAPKLMLNGVDRTKGSLKLPNIETKIKKKTMIRMSSSEDSEMAKLTIKRGALSALSRSKSLVGMQLVGRDSPGVLEAMKQGTSAAIEKIKNVKFPDFQGKIIQKCIPADFSPKIINQTEDYNNVATPVLIHVYRLKDCSLGFYHTGLEILGKELTYCCDAGIIRHKPKKCDFADYLGTVELGKTSMTPAQLEQVLENMAKEGGFSGQGYDVMERSCNNFTEALADRLGLLDNFPSAVQTQSRLGEIISPVVKMIDLTVAKSAQVHLTVSEMYESTSEAGTPPSAATHLEPPSPSGYASLSPIKHPTPSHSPRLSISSHLGVSLRKSLSSRGSFSHDDEEGFASVGAEGSPPLLHRPRINSLTTLLARSSSMSSRLEGRKYR